MSTSRPTNRLQRTRNTRSRSLPKVYPSPSGSSQGSTDLHDHISSSQSRSPSEVGPNVGRSSALSNTKPFPQDETRETDMPASGEEAQSSHGPSSSGRRSGPRPLQPSDAHHYPTPSSPIPYEDVHHVIPGGFQGPPQYMPAPPSPYSQRSAYIASTQQHPSTVGHANPPLPYPHGFGNPGLPVVPQDGSMMPQPMHPAFQPMMQSHAPVYHFQPHSPESKSSPHSSFPPSTAPPLYAHPRVDPSSPSHSPISTQPPSGSPNSPTTSYPGPHPFHPLGFPPTSQFPYSPHPFSVPGAMYQSQYAPGAYPQPYVRPPEQEGQAGWWYLPPSAPLPSMPYDGSQHSYAGQYSLPFSPMGRPDRDAPYGQSPPGPSSPGSSPLFSMSQPEPFPGSPPFSPTVVTTSPSSAHRDRSGSSCSETSFASGKPVVRRTYHPNPPSHRSEWVMWAGNVPSDATHNELRQFFNQPPTSEELQKPPDDAIFGGVVSIFLISRSSCAFINFETEAHLYGAIRRFNGYSLRPDDPRCLPFVCRVRRRDDDLKAGVGAQRGTGTHTQWVKDQKDKGRKVHYPDPQTTSSQKSHLESSSSGSGSGSYASTTSSILVRHFPKRYFILKSLTQYDLDLSVHKGLWATQRHNEGILDQAFRTAKDVYLIFGVNRSGEFYGYARMTGPVIQGEQKVPWAARSTESSSSSSPLSLSPVTGRMRLLGQSIPEEIPTTPNKDNSSPLSRSEHKSVNTSPRISDTTSYPSDLSLTIPLQDNRQFMSAPAVLGPPRHDITAGVPPAKHTLDSRKRVEPSPTTSKAPDTVERIVGPTRASSTPIDPRVQESPGLFGEKEHEVNPRTHSLIEETPRFGEDAMGDTVKRQSKLPETDDTREDAWGEPFKLEWLCTERLPFHRTRHLRNPWNNDREVKISRDGTELEPTVGQRLIEEWRTLAEVGSGGTDPGGGTSNSSREVQGPTTWKSAPLSATGSTK